MRLSQICIAIAQLGRGGAWSPLSLWPDGIATPGMWISPRTLDSEWQDYTGTTPVVTPGTVADSSNPVGLALDIRAGATVLTDPGNHMLQSTSAARPLMSARVNLLTYTEDFSNAAWAKADVSITPNSITSPDNGVTASKVTSSGSVTTAYVFQFIQNVALFSHSFYAKAGTSNFVCFTTNTNSCYANFNISTGSVASYSGCTAAISAVGDGWYRCSITEPASGVYFMILGKDADPGSQPYGTGVWASGNYIYLWGTQSQYGPSVVTPYQSVPGNGSTYATDFPIFQKYDGVDDGMATAALPAGTLLDGMDCLIAVRRDSNTLTYGVVGMQHQSQNVCFGIYTQGDTTNPCFFGAGTPTVWVDRVQLSDVTRGGLYANLPVGEWRIVEFRGLDLSAWTRAVFGEFGGGIMFPGARGDIMLYPSTASTTDKDAARQWLADYYGVTLP